MTKHRRAAKVDKNQADIVDALREIPGVTVEVGHDDILVGRGGCNWWFELKEPETVSKRTGQVRDSEIKDSQRKLLDTWQGHYKIAWTLEQILREIGIEASQSADL